MFNRAVVFDTVAPYWHGLPTPINCPEDRFRKTIAMYYLDDPEEETEERYRALFAPSEEQQDDNEVLSFIEKRSEL